MKVPEYESYHEQKSHFDEDFPYNTYPCSIPLDFTSVPLHWHEEAEFIYIKKGRGIITIDLTEYEVKAGQIAFVLPGQLHGILQKEQDSMEYENIIFSPMRLLSSKGDGVYEKYLAPLFEGELDIPSIFKEGEPLYDSVRGGLDLNDAICQSFPEGYVLGIKGNLYNLSYSIVSNSKKVSHTDKQSMHMDKLKAVLKYVELHYDEQMTIEEMASLVGFSQSHFMRFFKDTMGVSFINYLNDHRLTMATRLLLMSEDTVLAIAGQVGFENLSHFNRSFKKKYGMTPSEYRERY